MSDLPIDEAKGVELDSRNQAWLKLAVLIAFVVLGPILIGIASGAIGLPQLDDWNYTKVAFHLHSTGRLHILAWTSATVVGQIFWAQPFLAVFGNHHWVLVFSTAVLSVLCLVSAYALARRLVSPRYALSCVGLLAAGPGYLFLSASYMTDVPAMALEFSSLAIACVAMGDEKVNGRLAAVALLLGVAAFSIRDFALAVVIAEGLVFSIRSSRARFIVAASAVALIACLGIEYWRHVSVEALPVVAGFGWLRLTRTYREVYVLAITISPATVAIVVSRRHLWKPASIAAALGVVVYLVESIFSSSPFAPAGDYWTHSGVGSTSTLAGMRPLLLPVAWSVFQALVAAATFVLFYLAWNALRGVSKSRAVSALESVRTNRAMAVRALLISFVVLYGGALTLSGLTGTIFDRYLLPIIFLLAALMLSAAHLANERLPRRFMNIGVAALGLFSLVFLINFYSFTVAKWDAGNALVVQGIQPRNIDAGYEWVGYHGNDTFDLGEHFPPAPQAFYANIFGSDTDCYIVSASKVNYPFLRLMTVSDFKKFGFFDTDHIWTYRKVSRSCPLGGTAFPG